MFWEDCSPNPDLRYLVDHPSLISSSADAVCDFARLLGKQEGVDQVVIQGGRRTTGANPGKIHRDITFTVGE